MTKVVITELMDQAAVDWMSRQHDSFYDPKLVDVLNANPASQAELLSDCEGLIVRNRTQVNEALLAVAPNLKIVGRLGVGLDNIDMELCGGRGITVQPATGANAVAVAEYVVLAALLLRRNVHGATDPVIAGEWPRADFQGGELMGKTLGLMGFGNIAKEVAARLYGFGLEVIAYDPYLDPKEFGKAHSVDFDELLGRSQIISLHIPLNDSTRGIFNAETIAKMKPGGILINTARGGVIDEDAAIDALRAGHLGGLALDVFGEEPLSAEGARKFADTPNLLLTPHVAGITREANGRVSSMIARAVDTALKE